MKILPCFNNLRRKDEREKASILEESFPKLNQAIDNSNTYSTFNEGLLFIFKSFSMVNILIANR